MKKYRIIVAPRAQKDIRKYINYLRNVKKSTQAAQALFDDYRKTQKRLAETADIIKDPDNEKLKERQLKRINFVKHNYFLLFRIREDTVEIAAMFHELEDYDNKLPRET